MKKPYTLKAITILSSTIMLACTPAQGSELMAQEIQAAGEEAARLHEEEDAAEQVVFDFTGTVSEEEPAGESAPEEKDSDESGSSDADTQTDNDTDFTSSWDGPVLSAWAGTVMGPSGKETYYNLDMSGVVSIMRGMGNNDEYWVREDGCKMLGQYIMCAANLDVHPRGSLVESSLGTCIVCDTGGFAYENPTQLDIATTW